MSNDTTENETSHAKIDMLHGSIWNKLPQFAMPVAATAILEQLAKVLPDTKVTIRYVPDIAPSASGKRRYAIRECPLPGAAAVK